MVVWVLCAGKTETRVQAAPHGNARCTGGEGRPGRVRAREYLWVCNAPVLGAVEQHNEAERLRLWRLPQQEIRCGDGAQVCPLAEPEEPVEGALLCGGSEQGGGMRARGGR